MSGFSYCQSADVILREVAGEVFLIPTSGDESMLFELNPAAKWLWEQLAETKSAEALVDTLMARYRVERERACEDLKVFLDRMIERGLVTVQAC